MKKHFSVSPLADKYIVFFLAMGNLEEIPNLGPKAERRKYFILLVYDVSHWLEVYQLQEARRSISFQPGA